jgi:hypothetical protein
MAAYSESFWLAVSAAAATACALAIRSCYRSKCEDLSIFWGAINIHRDTAREQETDMEAARHRVAGIERQFSHDEIPERNRALSI